MVEVSQYPATLQKIIGSLLDTKANNIVVIDTQEKSSFTDYMVVCEGRSQAHVRGISENVDVELKKDNEYTLGVEGKSEGSWILMDYSDTIVHIFHPEMRNYYAIEKLYDDCPQETLEDQDPE